MKKYKIASIAGDGIGLEVVTPALKILNMSITILNS